MSRGTTIEITHRFPDGRPQRGTAIFPDFSRREWERSEHNALIARQDPDRPEKTWLSGEQQKHLRRALARDPYEAEARLARRGEKADPWPLEKLAKPGEHLRFGNTEFLNPLSDSGYRMALALRKAALEGNDFRAMMGSIRDAGFDILPQIKQEDDGSWTYSGMRFTRVGQHLSASQAGLMIRPTPGQERAPVLTEDGEWLLQMRNAYVARNRDLLLAQSRMRSEIRDIVEASRTGSEAGEGLREAGFTALPAGSDKSLMRSAATFFRDGIGVEMSWKAGRGVLRAARFLSHLEPVADVSPEP